MWTDYMTEAQEWAEITVGAAEKAMKEIYTNQLKFKEKGIALKQSVASRFNVSDILESFIYDSIQRVRENSIIVFTKDSPALQGSGKTMRMMNWLAHLSLKYDRVYCVYFYSKGFIRV